jgi:hypothetical protein
MGRRLMRTTGSGGTLSRSTNSSVSSTSSTFEEIVSFESSDDRDTSNYQVLLDTFIVLLQRDRDLLNYVFPTDLQSLVFTKLIELPLVYMREEGEKLCQSVERLPKKLDTGKFAIFGIFSILRWFLKSRPTFVKLFQVINQSFIGEEFSLTFLFRKVMQHVDNNLLLSQQHSNKRYIKDQCFSFESLFSFQAVTYLQGILDEVNNDSSPISQGGNVHPLTSHVLAFMEGLLAYEDTATIIATLYAEKEQRKSGSSGAEKGRHDLGTYLGR